MIIEFKYIKDQGNTLRIEPEGAKTFVEKKNFFPIFPYRKLRKSKRKY